MSAQLSRFLNAIGLAAVSVVFVLLMLLTLVIIMVFPQIALWLPEYVYSR